MFMTLLRTAWRMLDVWTQYLATQEKRKKSQAIAIITQLQESWMQCVSYTEKKQCMNALFC